MVTERLIRDRSRAAELRILTNVIVDGVLDSCWL